MRLEILPSGPGYILEEKGRSVFIDITTTMGETRALAGSHMPQR